MPENDGPSRDEGASVATELLAKKNWPAPSWTQKPSRRLFPGYPDYLVDRLRARYLELEGDFLTGFGNYHDRADIVTSCRIAELLGWARRGLERSRPDVGTISAELDQIERYMIWAYPTEISALESPDIRAKLEVLPESQRLPYAQQLAALFDETGALRPERKDDLLHVYDGIIGVCNACVLQQQINTGLQISRLKRLFWWGLGLTTLLFLSVPVAAGGVWRLSREWRYRLNWVDVHTSDALGVALAVALMGAAGGYLSGLLQVRNASVTLAEYQQSTMQLRLRPLVGVLVALLLLILLEGDALPGIHLQGLGALLLIALASGFSERYFLKLLQLDTADRDSTTAAAASGRKAEPEAVPAARLSPGDKTP